MRQHAKKMAATLTPEPVFNKPEATLEKEANENIPFPVDSSANQLNKGGEMAPLIINDAAKNKAWDMT